MATCENSHRDMITFTKTLENANQNKPVIFFAFISNPEEIYIKFVTSEKSTFRHYSYLFLAKPKLKHTISEVKSGLAPMLWTTIVLSLHTLEVSLFRKFMPGTNSCTKEHQQDNEG